MSHAISGMLVIAALLASTMIIYSTVLEMGTSQGVTLGEAAELQRERLSSLISIASAVPQDSGGGTDVTVQTDNTGGVSLGKFSDMDVVVQYTTQAGDPVLSWLAYVEGTPGSYQWSLCSGDPLVCGISPDISHPNMWDPDERVTLTLRLEPKMKASSSGTVIVGMPSGVTDSTSFAN